LPSVAMAVNEIIKRDVLSGDAEKLSLLAYVNKIEYMKIEVLEKLA
jgi:hypothetical protein